MNGQPADRVTQQRVASHLDRVRVLAGIDRSARVKSVNDFPISVGFASSSSAYAALSLAASRAAGLVLSERELSILARKGSGSACRSIPGGYVEWHAGIDDVTSYAATLAPGDYWDITIISVLMSEIQKKVSSLEGHAAVPSSPFAGLRPVQVAELVEHHKGWAAFAGHVCHWGWQVEREAIAFSLIAMTSRPAAYPWFSGIYYWHPDTMRLIQAVQRWRCEGYTGLFYAGCRTYSASHLRNTPCERCASALYHEFPENYPDIVTSNPGRGAWIIEEDNI